ncbi:YifB family Mg chelatase-like AAA ATPase [Bifidobacterium platyrrhinorum]|uniref:YifB family Mg chelatase-like AAA ATPase n=1 Tax=Bifidobacterium platyrrhinorum TaxID=2661628 RepID=A0A6L9SSF1_9BIFI|nr:YifB family Mg chelatase-like AAA ATPase [Bifidobacterium platyrrhinorum]NEG54723.1 YifB family Mg chelatase-like AAA ATPase [Bifidobacterium platyrrhinorum]
MAIGNALSVGLIGLRTFLVTMQAFISPGLPYFSIIGLPDASLSEARERVKSACQATGFQWPQTRVTVNLSPASMPKRGSSHDLAIASAVLSAAGAIPHDCLIDTITMGEVNLDGTVLPVNGVLPILLHARERGIRQVILPAGNMDEADLIDGVDVVGVRHVGELIELMGGNARYRPPDRPPTRPDGRSAGTVPSSPPAGDMIDVVGQEQAKWALEVAAAGGHHMIMVGPPGSGKTMLASRMPGIMCPLTETEQLEVASIRSLCGTLGAYGITDVPPFEAPHHTSSTAALVGGGTGMAEPGAITRAHRGVLFMDEAPEFSARALQTLREPLESGYVALSRSKGTTYYPAAFQLIMAANGCPCGMSYGTGERCVCSHRERQRYFGRLSGPILDRIDIQVEVPPVPRITGGDAIERGHTSAQIRQRVIQARRTAMERYDLYGWTCNAQASGAWLRDHISPYSLEPINRALERQRLSLRGADRAMRLAWTLADLNGEVSPGREEIDQGIALRSRLI